MVRFSMVMKKTMEVIFVPGCFDDFEGTQEELDMFVEMIQTMAKDGSLLENSIIIAEDDNTADIEQLFDENKPRTLN